jgi:hypothetical protein
LISCRDAGGERYVRTHFRKNRDYKELTPAQTEIWLDAFSFFRTARLGDRKEGVYPSGKKLYGFVLETKKETHIVMPDGRSVAAVYWECMIWKGKDKKEKLGEGKFWVAAEGTESGQVIRAIFETDFYPIFVVEMMAPDDPAAQFPTDKKTP